MASIKIDVINLLDAAGEMPADELHQLTAGLDVTFDQIQFEGGVDWEIEFTGPRAHLIELLERYEDDRELLPGLIDEIVEE